MYTPIDSLPLGKLLQPIQQGGVKKQVPADTSGVPKSKIRKIRKKGYK